MARSAVTPKMIIATAEAYEAIANLLREAAEMLQTEKIQEMPLHWDTLAMVNLLSAEDRARRVLYDVERYVRTMKLGKEMKLRQRKEPDGPNPGKRKGTA